MRWRVGVAWPRSLSHQLVCGPRLAVLRARRVVQVYFEAAQIEDRAASVVRELMLPFTACLPAHGGEDDGAGTGAGAGGAGAGAGARSAATAVDKERCEKVAADCLARARAAYVRSARNCPSNLRWKVWLAGARTELGAGDARASRALLQRALVDVPPKSRSQVLLEQSRVEEYCGNVVEARSVLARARKELGHQWKVFLESVLLERRVGQRLAAVRVVVPARGWGAGSSSVCVCVAPAWRSRGPWCVVCGTTCRLNKPKKPCPCTPALGACGRC